MTSPTREVELKAVVPDVTAARRSIEERGAKLLFEGRLEDRRYDNADRTLSRVDHVLRLRIYRTSTGVSAHLDWKGPTQYAGGFKVRDELTTAVAEPDALAAMLDLLGYTVTREIDRDIAQYGLEGTVIRFEQYPRMDALVEVEGTPEGIENAIAALGMHRGSFTTARLPDFARAFEQRTGEKAALCDRELAGDYRYQLGDS